MHLQVLSATRDSTSPQIFINNLFNISPPRSSRAASKKRQRRQNLTGAFKCVFREHSRKTRKVKAEFKVLSVNRLWLILCSFIFVNICKL